jgi:hypothetical protein
MDPRTCEACGDEYDVEECPRCAARELEAAEDPSKLWLPVLHQPVELTNDGGVRFVNVYFVQRCFGGREEGGWWYDCGELLRCIVLPTEAAAQELKASLEAGDFSNQGRRPLSSVLSEGAFRVTIDSEPGCDWPAKRPRYE